MASINVNEYKGYYYGTRLSAPNAAIALKDTEGPAVLIFSTAAKLQALFSAANIPYDGVTTIADPVVFFMTVKLNGFNLKVDWDPVTGVGLLIDNLRIGPPLTKGVLHEWLRLMSLTTPSN